jgi:hypothetical protein
MDVSTPQALADLVKMVGFPIMCAAYFMWKDKTFTQKISDDLAAIREHTKVI